MIIFPRLFKDGEWSYEVVDDWLPCGDDGSLACGQSTAPSEAVLPLLLLLLLCLLSLLLVIVACIIVNINIDVTTTIIIIIDTCIIS